MITNSDTGGGIGSRGGNYKMNLIKCDHLRQSLESSAVGTRKRKGY